MAERSIGKIARIIEARPILAEDNAMVRRLLLDSRQFSSPDGVLFFALRGKNHDGHDYIRELIRKGVCNFVVEELPENQFADCNFLIVPDALAALQKLAREVRSESAARVIGITGSNGKTIVKEWLSQILQKRFSLCRSPKSYNSQIGVPLSVWELEPYHEFGIFEAGISEPGEMDKLEEILKPEIGILTNIGSAHDINFENQAAKLHEKLKLFRNCQMLVYQKNDGFLSKEIEAFAEEHHIKLLSWSLRDESADLFVKSTEEEGAGTRLKMSFRGEDLKVHIPFADEASVQNALHALRTALELGVAVGDCQKAAANLQAVEMRLEMKAGTRDNIIINDAYNSDLESLRVALHYLQHQARQHQKILILSDILQSGLEPGDLYKKVEEVINRFDLDRVIAIGPELQRSGIELKAKLDFYSDTEEFLSRLQHYQFRECAILLKGARRFRFEEISTRLEEKSHETVLNIYLDRVVHNLNYFRSKLRPDTGIMAMVKAFSYGSGSYEIANLLQFHKVDYLGVAYTDEGVELRQMGISLPILVLNPEESSFEDLITHRLEPEIYSLPQLQAFEKTLERSGANSKFPIHLKVETGMNRLGFSEGELDELLAHLQDNRYVKVASVFSHLAASDTVEEREFTLQQVALFKQMCDKLQEGLKDRFLRHLCNSSGISAYPEAHFDMVRLGIGLYGVGSYEEDKKHLQVVSELITSVSQTKEIAAGESVSYGRTFKADAPRKIAVVAIGYADGFRRSLSNGVGEVAISGQRYPVVGRVCMDMMMIDITGSDVQAGDRVEIFGSTVSIYELADKMETIPYEVFTGVSQRVKRVYFMD